MSAWYGPFGSKMCATNVATDTRTAVACNCDRFEIDWQFPNEWSSIRQQYWQILLNKPERRLFKERIAADTVRLMSVATFLEAVALTLEQAALARAAYRQFGRGNHPVSLNFGDCLAYALAKFSKTAPFQGTRLFADRC
jgi:hypothetical protein